MFSLARVMGSRCILVAYRSCRLIWKLLRQKPDIPICHVPHQDGHSHGAASWVLETPTTPTGPLSRSEQRMCVADRRDDPWQGWRDDASELRLWVWEFRGVGLRDCGRLHAQEWGLTMISCNFFINVPIDCHGSLVMIARVREGNGGP